MIILAGALLSEAEELIRMGLKPTEIADGYEMALEKALAVLETLSCAEIKVRCFCLIGKNPKDVSNYCEPI